MKYKWSPTLLFLILSCFLSQESIAQPRARLDLAEAVNLALLNNPRITIARTKREQNQGLLTQARSGYLPTVSMGAGLDRQHIDNLNPEEDTVASASLVARQLIYDFGNTLGAIDAGRQQLDAAAENLDQVNKDIVLALKAGFYKVLARRYLINVEQQAVVNYAQQLYRAKKYFAAGIRTKIDISNAEVNLANAQLALLKARSNLQVARIEFEEILGLRPNQGHYELVSNAGELSQLAAGKPQLPAALESLLEEALISRSDKKQLDYLVAAARAEIRRARSGFFPSLQAEASLNQFETDLSSFQDQWFFGVRLNWELFSGFRSRGETATARARYAEMIAALKQLELAIRREVTNSWLRGVEYRDSVTIADQSMRLAAENFTLADKRYQAGLNDMIEYNDAQVNLTRAQSNLITTYFDYLTALADIEHAVGRAPEVE